VQPAPLKLQVTAVFDVPVTVAVKDCMLAAETETFAGLMFTLAEADFVGSATLVAVTLTVAGEGTLGGGE
jgi:hypothetical protein